MTHVRKFTPPIGLTTVKVFKQETGAKVQVGVEMELVEPSSVLENWSSRNLAAT